MASHKKYWKSIEELKPDSKVVPTLKQKEFAEQLPVGRFFRQKDKLEASSTSRRDFLKFVGFSTAAAGLAACEGSVKKSIPYIVQPEQIRPGVANYYATSIADGYDFANMLVKTVEGRPVKIQYNTLASNRFSPNTRVLASVLSLYDSLRIQAPKCGDNYTSWGALDAATLDAIKKAKEAGKEVVLLTQTFASPTTETLIKNFSDTFGGVRHVSYDAVSYKAATNAFEKVYGIKALADYDLSKADVIVSFGADFLADWQGGGFDAAYAKGRIPKDGKMSFHVQIESNMTLSGANADRRLSLKPSQQKVALAVFYGYLSGVSIDSSLPEKVKAALKKTAKRVKETGSNAVVITGIQDENAQLLVLEINRMLKSEVMDTDAPILSRQGDCDAVTELVEDMNKGKVGVLITSGVNPAYTLPNSNDFIQALKKVDFSLAFSMKEDETSSLTTYIAAAPHYLESWGDTEFKKGYYGLTQPTIKPLFDTRQFQDALLKWSGSDQTYYQYIKSYWDDNILDGTSWNRVLHDGAFFTTPKSIEAKEFDATLVAKKLSQVKSLKGFELQLYTKIGMGDGQQANNPWLQEFPDPITRVSWDNYVTVSKADADELDLENRHVANGALNGSYATIKLKDVSLTLPVIIQPGQAKGSLGVCLGYGKTKGIKEEMHVGKNAYVLYKDFEDVQQVYLSLSEGEHEFACIQLHNTLMGRGDIIRETTLNEFKTKPKEQWNETPQVSLDHNSVPADSVSLWNEFDNKTGHHFNLSIDLNACTGCGACVISCHAENNVPVVGKAEVRRSRDMHWIRIDRYYSSEDTFLEDNEKKDNISGLSKSMTEFSEMELASENPQVAFQPVMCQHCEHAPCETVCPWRTTSHGHQGQNHMAYNRCVGTRYCANNCPYKVRRFNWFLYNNNDEFDYHMNDDLGRMVLNPDVVVRSRGVMEKCSFCIQKTQKVILDAKREGRPVEKDEFGTACTEACSSGAMVFGDVNNEESSIKEKSTDKRAYHLLGHVGTKPNVFYQVKVRNTEEV